MIAALPKVSIIIPSLNQARYLEECILSVLGQDYPNIEYLVMDGGSTDGSVAIIQEYSPRLAGWVSRPDGGQAAALNAGLRRATGEIWAWMNADDAYLPGAVGRAVAWLGTHPDVDILYGDCLVVDEHGQRQRYFRAPEFRLQSTLTGAIGIPSGSAFIRRAVFERVGGFDESLHYALDSNYWLRAALMCTFAHLPEPLSLYRIHPAAKTWDVGKSVQRAAEIVAMNEQFWDRADLPPAVRRFERQSLVNAYLYAADLTIRAGQRALCRDYLKKSLGLGVLALKPRLARLLLQLWLGEFSKNIRD